MDASDSQTQHQGVEEVWFRPGTYSVWAYDREGRGTPILLVLYEWEIEGLRGLYLVSALGSLHEMDQPEDKRDNDYRMFHREVSEPARMESLELANLIGEGHLHRIGLMPPLEKYAETPPACKTPRQPATDQVSSD